jgi:prepilin-type N-terminal cleavage/methylation domain-containing protein
VSAAHLSFAYRAAHGSGLLETGTIRAESAEAARELLSARGLFPVEVRLERGGEGARPRMSAGDMALGLRVLATLLESGLPVGRALAAMDDLVPAPWKPALPAMRDAVRQGGSLAAALAAAPVGVPPLVVGLVQAGEAGAGAAPAVARAAELMERSAETRRAVRAALAYPLVLAAAGVASLALLVGFVLPRFAAVLAELGQGLPPTARTVLALAEGARMGAIPGVLTVASALALWRVWVGTAEGRARWHAFLLALPGVGTIRRAAATGRFCAALGALLESGVPIAPALAHASRATGDAALSARGGGGGRGDRRLAGGARRGDPHQRPADPHRRGDRAARPHARARRPHRGRTRGADGPLAGAGAGAGDDHRLRRGGGTGGGGAPAGGLQREARPVTGRRGFTLAELMVVLAVLGVMAGVAGLAARSLERTDPEAERDALVAAARREALRTRRPVELVLPGAEGPLRLTALPDGSVRADAGLGLDPLTGRPRAAR